MALVDLPEPAPGPIPLAWGQRAAQSVGGLNDAVEDLVAALPALARKGSDTSRASTTALADDPDLTLPVIAGGQYLLQGVLHVTGNASGDLNLRWTGPANTNGLILVLGAAQTIASGTIGDGDFFPNLFAAAASSNASAYGVTANGPALLVQGWISTAGAGALTLQWAQNVSNGTGTVLKANSYIGLTLVNP